MAVQIPVATLSLSSAVTAVAALIATALDATGNLGDHVYEYVANTDSWIAQGVAPVATAGTGSLFVPARLKVLVDGSGGVKLSTIRDSADGRASLTPIAQVK